MAQLVREIMTGAPVTVAPETPVVDIARRMRQEDIGAVLVTEDGEPKGLVTDRDLTVRVLAEGGDASGKRVRDACSSRLVSVTPGDGIDHAVHLMRTESVRRLPVVEDGQAVGMVSLGDLAVEREPGSALGDISAAGPNA